MKSLGKDLACSRFNRSHLLCKEINGATTTRSTFTSNCGLLSTSPSRSRNPNVIMYSSLKVFKPPPPPLYNSVI